jgi:hypothetical protein
VRVKKKEENGTVGRLHLGRDEMAIDSDPRTDHTTSIVDDRKTVEGQNSVRNHSAHLLWSGRLLAQVLDLTTFVPAVVSWRVSSDYVLHPGFKCKNYPGLLQCYLVRVTPDQSELLTYWRSDRHFQSQRAAFIRANQLERAESWSGELADVRAARRSIWPTSPFDALQKVAAVIGAIVVVYQAYIVLWAEPKVSVAIESSQPLNAGANSDFPVHFAFSNQNLSTSAQVQLAVHATKPDVTIDERERFFTLGPGGRQEITLNALAGKSGIVPVEIDATVKAGRWRGRQRVMRTIAVRVWSVLPEFGAFAALANECRPNLCVARAELSAGRREAIGFRCWAHLIGYPAINMRAVRTSIDGGQPSARGEGEARVTKIDWRQAPSEAFRRQAIDLVLVAEPPLPEWQSVLSGIRWLCEELSLVGG